MDNPGTQILSIGNGDSFLNDRGEYHEMTYDGKAQIEACKAFCGRMLKKHNQDKLVTDVARPYDRTIWSSMPYLGSCGYTPCDYSISINAAFAQDPNYRTDMSDKDYAAFNEKNEKTGCLF